MTSPKRAVVVGGSSGIGLAVAARLLSDDIRVAIAARNRERLGDAAGYLGRLSGNLVPTASVDTRDARAVGDAIDTLADSLGGIDIVVSSGYTPHGIRPVDGLVGGFADTDLLDAFETKLLGYLHVIRSAVPHLRTAGGGRIILIGGQSVSSSSSLLGAVRNAPVAALAAVLAAELAPDHITVNIVHPGHTRLPGTPEGAEADASTADVAGVVAFLASPAAAAVTGEAISTGFSASGYVRTYR